MAKGFSTISMPEAEHAFFEAFARKVSKQVGIDLKVWQALKKAAVQYEVKNGIL